MSDVNNRCLEIFPGWLKQLAEDAAKLLNAAADESLPTASRECLVGALNYLFKSLDLIPDGIDDIGYLDDAFVMRLAAKEAEEEGLGSLSGETLESLKSLAGDTDLIKELLEDALYERFASYVHELRHGSARGRTVDDILSKPEEFKQFSEEVAAFGSSYEVPAFSHEEKNLIKLKAFFEAKLPE